jgi:hypothetical protein
MSTKEKRIFNRYKSQSKCVIELGPTTYKGIVVDYSVNGVCVIVQNDPQFVEGATSKITIPDLKMEFNCEIVWVKVSGEDLKAGFKMIDGMKGILKHFMLSDILIGLQKSAGTGVLFSKTEI